MAININPNRINVSSGSTGKASDRRRSQSGNEFVIPTRAAVNNVPEPDTLHTLIRSAIAALREGVYWDRGTILNLMV